MLTRTDLLAVKQLLKSEMNVQLHPIKSDIGVLKRGIKALRKGQERLQDSINTLTDDLGEDVYVLKEEKMKKVEHHLGWATT